jgi:predicted RecA/RadA family phage recombinase
MAELFPPVYSPGFNIPIESAPFAVTAGELITIGGALHGVAATNAAIGEAFTLTRGGVHNVDKETGAGTGGSAGDPAYAVGGPGVVTVTAVAGTEDERIGVFYETVADGVATARVLLFV